MKNILLYSLLIFLCWLWLNRDESAASEGLIELQTVVDSYVEEAESVQDAFVYVPSADGVTQQCPFPIKQDLDGLRFKLNLTSAIKTANFYSLMNEAVNKLFSKYSSWLGEESVSGFVVDMIVLPEDEFHTFMIGRVAVPEGYLGAYFPNENLAVIKYVNEEQAIRTGIHEVTHAVNFALFGELPRFINEGLAEYIERTAFVGISGNDFILPKHIDKTELKNELLDFYSLMHSEQDWHTSNNNSLYFSGSAWAYFLMTSEQGLSAMQQLLQTKLENPCQTLTSEQIIITLSEVYPNFEQDFYYWFAAL